MRKKQEQNDILSKTTFINPVVVQLEKELKLLTQQKHALDATKIDHRNVNRGNRIHSIVEKGNEMYMMRDGGYYPLNERMKEDYHINERMEGNHHINKRMKENHPLDNRNAMYQTQKERKEIHHPLDKQQTKTICTHFCKFGHCIKVQCRNIHDKNLVRICPSFLKV